MSGDNNIITNQSSFSDFEKIKHTDGDGEFWYGRELMDALGYTNWRNFFAVIEKARKSSENSGASATEHFHNIVTTDNIDDYRLSRYACYIIAQNGDAVRKPKIAEAQAYFAIQTRRQELSDQELKDETRLERRKEFSESDRRLSENIMEVGVSAKGMINIKESGNRTFFGGKSSKEMRGRLGTGTKPWADKASNVVLAGKTFANELTSASIEYKGAGVGGAPKIKEINDENNQAVRDIIRKQQGLFPEDFPPSEDTKKIERRIAKNNKNLLEQ